jgi:ribosomal protein S27AE
MAGRHSFEYESVLHSERWRKVRAEALRRARHRCQRCGASADELRLDAHHWAGYSMLGRERPEDLQILCRPCHDRVHSPGFYSTGFLKLLFWIVVLVIAWVIIANTQSASRR